MNRCLYSGIFKEEICVHFLNACIKITHIYFDELFKRCEDPVKIRECLGMMKNWSPSLFNHEFDNIRREIPNIEDMFKSTFIIFVKQFHERPGCPKLQIRMTMPPVFSFVQNFAVLMSSSELLCSGDWNNAAHAISLKDVVMDVTREVMHGFIADYVIVQELVPNALPSALDDVEACDSASNVASNPPTPPAMAGILQERSVPKKRPPSSVTSVKKEKRVGEEKANDAPSAQSMFKKRVNSMVGGSGDKRSGISISHIGSLREKLRVKDESSPAKIATTAPPPAVTTPSPPPGSPMSQYSSAPMTPPPTSPLAPPPLSSQPHPPAPPLPPTPPQPSFVPQPLPTASSPPPPPSPNHSASGTSSRNQSDDASSGASSEGTSSGGESSEGESSEGESSEGESSDDVELKA